ncbi:hypothetical protein DY000_02050534 [Brassica cretica]|uniref:Uncharacterized protein n=1 Tax=Brassica cretica TaxID=69181 RepID=A0ABQ7EQS9_BRACR|nr:hypothetical protein DY000_02050534 [Brassica cretica]
MGGGGPPNAGWSGNNNYQQQPGGGMQQPQYQNIYPPNRDGSGNPYQDKKLECTSITRSLRLCLALFWVESVVLSELEGNNCQVEAPSFYAISESLCISANMLALQSGYSAESQIPRAA